MIKIDFSYETPHGLFGDALILPEDHGLSDEEIEALKRQRLNAWLEFIETLSAE